MYAEKKVLFGADFQSLSNLSRIYRNFIHPGKELKEELNKAKSDLCFICVMEILRKIFIWVILKIDSYYDFVLANK